MLSPLTQQFYTWAFTPRNGNTGTRRCLRPRMSTSALFTAGQKQNLICFTGDLDNSTTVLAYNGRILQLLKMML